MVRAWGVTGGTAQPWGCDRTLGTERGSGGRAGASGASPRHPLTCLGCEEEPGGRRPSGPARLLRAMGRSCCRGGDQGLATESA